VEAMTGSGSSARALEWHLTHCMSLIGLCTRGIGKTIPQSGLLYPRSSEETVNQL
jgi:hypothetical protein